MQEWFLVLSKITEHLHYILQILIGCNRLVHIVACRLHRVLSGRVLDDLSLLQRLHQPEVVPECNSGLIRQLGMQCLSICSRGIPLDCPCTFVRITADIVIRHKLNDSRRSTVEEALRSDLLKLFRSHNSLFCHRKSLSSHCFLANKKDLR